MEENNNKRIDAFLKKQIQEIPLETPSQDFTSSIMDVLHKEKSTVLSYQPLISKKMWFVVAAAIIAVLVIPFQKTEGSLLSKVNIDFSFLEKLSLSGLFDGVEVSLIALYGALFFTVMIFIQVVFLKNHFNKQIDAGL